MHERKAQRAHGEGNSDGAADDRAESFGAEGESDNEQVVAARARQRRTFIATLLVCRCCSAATSGARTQRGNNNALPPGRRDHLPV
jgi:isoamylase